MVTISENYWHLHFSLQKLQSRACWNPFPVVRVCVCVRFNSGIPSSMNWTYNVGVFHLSGNPINRGRLGLLFDVKFILSSFIFHLWCNWWCEWNPNFVILVCFFPSLSSSFPCFIRVPFIFDDKIYEGIAIQGLFLDCLRILVTLPFHLVSMKKGTVWLK